MSKVDRFPKIRPQIPSMDLKGLTLYQLYRRQELNNLNLQTLKDWLDDLNNPVAYSYWIEFDKLRKKLIWAIRLKRLKLWLLSLVGRN